ncbi:MAG: hypothetical protein ABIN67_20060, partial [Ferruginibacter sp.]
MNGREHILKAISTNKPTFIAAPELTIDRPVISDLNLLNFYIQKLESIGGKAIVVNGYDYIKTDIEQSGREGGWIVNTIPEAGDTDKNLNELQDATALETVHKAYIRGTIGVAENGAVWVKESQAINRLLPFICQHLVLVINA